MKVILFSATLVLFMAVVQCDPNFQQLMKQCMEEQKVAEEDLKAFLASGMQGSANENLSCYLKCLMEKQGHMTNGMLNAEAMINSLKSVPQIKDRMDEITSGVNACSAIKGANDCDTAFKIFMCLKEHKATISH